MVSLKIIIQNHIHNLKGFHIFLIGFYFLGVIKHDSGERQKGHKHVDSNEIRKSNSN
jgi:hypothetical protein